jgi:hypothetical protein
LSFPLRDWDFDSQVFHVSVFFWLLILSSKVKSKVGLIASEGFAEYGVWEIAKGYIASAQAHLKSGEAFTPPPTTCWGPGPVGDPSLRPVPIVSFF